MAPKRTRSSSGQQKLSFSVRKKESPISSVKDSIKKDIKSEKKQVHEPIEIIETKEENGKRHLDLESKEYEEYYAELTKNDVTGPVHYEDYNTVDKILRQFDFASDYGPVAGLSRLERWERAYKLNKQPPEIVKDILTTEEGLNDIRYSQSYLYNHI